MLRDGRKDDLAARSGQNLEKRAEGRVGHRVEKGVRTSERKQPGKWKTHGPGQCNAFVFLAPRECYAGGKNDRNRMFFKVRNAEDTPSPSYERIPLLQFNQYFLFAARNPSSLLSLSKCCRRVSCNKIQKLSSS